MAKGDNSRCEDRYDVIFVVGVGRMGLSQHLREDMYFSQIVGFLHLGVIGQ